MNNRCILLRLLVGILPAAVVFYLIFYINKNAEFMNQWMAAALILCLLLLSLFILSRTMGEIRLAEALEKEGDRRFFSEFEAEATPDSLRRKFIGAGFSDNGDGVLCKKKLSFGFDVINYCAVIESYGDTSGVLKGSSMSPDENLTSGNGIFSKNVCVFRICFTSGVTQRELEHIRKEIIADELVNDAVVGGRSGIISAVCPIIYDTAAHKYIMRSVGGSNTSAAFNKAYAYFKKIALTQVNVKED